MSNDLIKSLRLFRQFRQKHSDEFGNLSITPFRHNIIFFRNPLNKERGCEIIQPTKRNEEAPGPVKDWGLNHGII